MRTLRWIGTTVLVLAGLLASAPPASADALVQVSCRVTTRWICETDVLIVEGNGSTTVHLFTTGIPTMTQDGPGNSFVRILDVSVPWRPEIFRQYRYSGAEHDHWVPNVHYRYVAELHCPYTCQGARLYFANY